MPRIPEHSLHLALTIVVIGFCGWAAWTIITLWPFN